MDENHSSSESSPPKEAQVQVEPKRERQEDFEEGQLEPSDLRYPDPAMKEEANFKTVDKVAEEGNIEEAISASDSTQRTQDSKANFDDQSQQQSSQGFDQPMMRLG